MLKTDSFDEIGETRVLAKSVVFVADADVTELQILFQIRFFESLHCFVVVS